VNASVRASRRRRSDRTISRVAALISAFGATLGGGVIGSGCLAERSVPVEIRFAARVGDVPLSCDAGAATATQPARLVPQDLRFYVHDVELIDAAGNSTPVELDHDGVWQDASVALLDFEDAAGSCANGTSGMHASITGRAPDKEYTGVRFVLGVPFALNHADSAQAKPPLNLGRMHWGWQAGYKFLRFEALRAEGEALRFHLGSTGCEGSIGHIERCRWPNRAVVALHGFDPRTDEVVVDVGALERAAESGDGRGICMSEAGDSRCSGPFAVIGLDPGSGAAIGKQHLFTVSRS
jgi:uncharacterized repeat protein (TIGR04052 family)